MIIQFTNEKAINAYNALLQVLQKGEQSFKFNYAVIKNKNHLESIIKGISKQLVEIDKEREELCKQYCEKDEKGNPIIENQNYKGLFNNEEFNKKIDLWKEKKESFMQESFSFDGYKIERQYLPEKMQGNLQEALMNFISEDDTNEKEIKIN